MSLEALAEAIQVDASDIVRSLFMKGIMLSMNQVRPRACGEEHKRQALGARSPSRSAGQQGGRGGVSSKRGEPGSACRLASTPRGSCPCTACSLGVQVLDKNTVKLVAGEYDLLVVDKDEAGVADAAKKRTEFMDADDFDNLVARPPVVRSRDGGGWGPMQGRLLWGRGALRWQREIGRAGGAPACVGWAWTAGGGGRACGGSQAEARPEDRM